MSKTLVRKLTYAVLAGAGAFVAQLQADGIADEVGGYSILLTGLLGVAAEYITEEEGDNTT